MQKCTGCFFCVNLCNDVLTMLHDMNIIKVTKARESMTTVSVRMDENLKRDFDEICNELGLSMTTAITMLAKKMTREKRIPFEVSMDPFYSASNMAALNDSIEEMRQGKTVTRTLEELEAMEHE